MAGRPPARLAAGLAGERRQAASAVGGLGAAGITAGASGVWGQVVLLLLLVCISGSALLAAVVLRGQWEGHLRDEAPLAGHKGTRVPVHQ